ncbi:hypothetical protein V6N13_109161 [Hibiscus sabdariffa]
MVKVIFWNAQGTLGLGFNRYFILLLRSQDPNTVVIMELWDSGLDADNFIRRSGSIVLTGLRLLAFLKNVEAFGHIRKRKARLLARNQGVELVLDVQRNPYLLTLEEALKKELNMVLEHEESLWF